MLGCGARGARDAAVAERPHGTGAGADTPTGVLAAAGWPLGHEHGSLAACWWRRQIELVEDQTGNMDPKTNFKLIIIQTELERFKFLVRSFLRARIKKVCALQ
jgi:hypothetical protein